MSAVIILALKSKLLRKLKEFGAFSEQTAKSLDEIDMLNVEHFPGLINRMIKKGEIVRTDDDKYYLN